MKQISKLFLVSLLSGATTLGAYKLLFDNNGYFSSNKHGITTLAPESYGRQVGLAAEKHRFYSRRRQNCTHCSSRKECICENDF